METNYDKIVGDNLVRLRGDASLAEVCARILRPDGEPEMNAKTLLRLERASHSSKIETVALAARLYGVEPWQLLDPNGVQRAQKPTDVTEVVDDYMALPPGLRYFVARKARELRQFAERIPTFMRESLKAIPEESNYWKWERELDSFVREQKARTDDEDYVGPERRTSPMGKPLSEPDRRGSKKRAF